MLNSEQNHEECDETKMIVAMSLAKQSLIYLPSDASPQTNPSPQPKE
jgi:hypothetical protein